MKRLILQLHIPFCYKRCDYCGQAVCRYDDKVIRAYVEAMVRELEAAAPDMEEYEVAAVALEGGSPALAGPGGLQELLRSVRRCFRLAADAQLSIQTMPGEYSRALMEKLRDCGVNHWIFGIATANAAEHALLGRPYRYDALSMVDAAIKTFDVHKRSFELLYGIPGQTARSFLQSLERALYYAPEHVTLLPLELQQGTELLRKCRSGEVQACTAEEKAALYAEGRKRLEAAGYRAYTIWDFARPGGEDRCRLERLAGTEQLGIGYGAVTVQGGVTYTGGHSLREYLEHSDDVSVIADRVARLGPEAELERSARAALATERGLNADELIGKYGGIAERFFTETGNALQENGMAIQKDGRLYLTEKGIVSFQITQ